MNGMALRRTGKDTNGGGIVLCRYGFGKHRNERDANRRAMEQKRSVRRARDKHCIALVTKSIQRQGRRRAKIG